MGNFGDYQYQFYKAGVLNKTSPFPFTFAEWEHRACESMDPLIYGYVKGGAGDEETQDINVTELRRYGLTPRMLRDRSERDMSVTFLDRKLPSPVFLCPVGVLGNIRPEGDLEAARVCDELDLVGMYSTLSSATIEEVAEARGRSFGVFQLYPTADEKLTESIVMRAERAGFDAIAVTVDYGTVGWRPRDLSHGFMPMMRGDCIANYTSDPRFRELAGVTSEKDLDPMHAGAVWMDVFANPAFTWHDLTWLRQITELPLIVKGICLPDDAAHARQLGVDVIACSNHGGRQANGGVPAICHLEPVIEAAGGLPVTYDSGIRDGVDVLRACGLGGDLLAGGRAGRHRPAVRVRFGGRRTRGPADRRVADPGRGRSDNGGRLLHRAGSTRRRAAGLIGLVHAGKRVLVAGGLEPFHRALHLGFGIGAAHPVGGLDIFARFQRLVLREEVFDGVQFELRNVADVLDVIPPVVTGRYAQHLVVAAGFVGHPEHADRARPDQYAREQWLR